MVKANLTDIALHELFCYIGVGTLTSLKCFMRISRILRISLIPRGTNLKIIFNLSF